MLWEIIKYVIQFLVISLVLLIEQVLSLPFIFFTLLILWTNFQTKPMLILTTVLMSLFCAVVFSESWLLMFGFIIVTVNVMKLWQTKYGKTWWLSNLHILFTVAFFSMFVPPQPTAQFLVFSGLSYVISLIILWSNYRWVNKNKFYRSF